MKPSTTKSFAPTIRLADGSTVAPPGWMWVVAFALGDCEWAIRKADTEEFKATVRQWMKDRDCHRLRRQIEEGEHRLAELRRELHLINGNSAAGEDE